MAPKNKNKNKHRDNKAEPEKKVDGEAEKATESGKPETLEGTGESTLALPPTRGTPPPRAGHDEEERNEDPELRAAREREKRDDLDKDYYDKVAERDARIEGLEKENAKLAKDNAGKQQTIATQDKQYAQLEQQLESMKKELDKATTQRDALASETKNHLATLNYKDQEYRQMQQKKADEFQAKKAAQKELAEARATIQALHQNLDRSESLNAEYAEKNTTVADQMHDIHTKLEASFTDIPAGTIPTPELVDKVTERIAELSQGTLQRGDSRTSMHSDQGKTHKSLNEELFGEDEEEGDITLTVDAELEEMREKADRLERLLETEKEKGEAYLRRIAADGQTMERLQKQHKPLGLGPITTVATSPISPAPPSAPAPPEPQVLIQTVEVPVKPTANDLWNAVSGPWLFAAVSLLVAFFAFCAWVWWTGTTERDLWLGANDVARAGAVRLASNRKEAYCGWPASPLEGPLAPLWRWLEIPSPVLLT